jgi:hypothetical protein
MVARDGVEPPTPAFSELILPVFSTTSRVAVGLPNTGKYGQDGRRVGDCRGRFIEVQDLYRLNFKVSHLKPFTPLLFRFSEGSKYLSNSLVLVTNW